MSMKKSVLLEVLLPSILAHLERFHLWWLLLWLPGHRLHGADVVQFGRARSAFLS